MLLRAARRQLLRQAQRRIEAEVAISRSLDRPRSRDFLLNAIEPSAKKRPEDGSRTRAVSAKCNRPEAFGLFIAIENWPRCEVCAFTTTGLDGNLFEASKASARVLNLLPIRHSMSTILNGGLWSSAQKMIRSFLFGLAKPCSQLLSRAPLRGDLFR